MQLGSSCSIMQENWDERGVLCPTRAALLLHGASNGILQDEECSSQESRRIGRDAVSPSALNKRRLWGELRHREALRAVGPAEGHPDLAW